jgi:hypothetical protein
MIRTSRTPSRRAAPGAALLAAAFLLLTALPSLAEGKDTGANLISPATEFPSSAGMFASLLGGTLGTGGLSYQQWIGSFGIGVTAGGMAYPQTEVYGTDADPVPEFATWSYSIQVDLLYRLYSSNFWNWLSGDLFAFLSLGHVGARDGVYFEDPDGDYNTQDWYYTPGDYEAVFFGTVGIGYEIVLFRHFSVPLMFGYSVEYPFLVDFTFATGLRYRF